MKRQVKQGVILHEKKETLPVKVEESAASALAGFLSPNTKRAYERDLKDFFGVEDLSTLPVGRLLGVLPDEVTAFRDHLMTSKKPSTVARKLSAVRAVYAYLMAKGAIRLNPADAKLVRSPKRSTIRKTGYLSWDEAKEMLRAPNRTTPTGKRDYAMLLLCINTGLRRSELCHLKDEDLYEQGGRWCLRVRGKGEKERLVPIRGDVELTIRDWKRVRPKGSEWLFTTASGERFSEHQFWKLVRRYAKEVGLEAKLHPHALRAAYIGFLHAKGISVGETQQLVGHSRGDTTLSYIRELDLMKSAAPDALAGLDAGANRAVDKGL